MDNQTLILLVAIIIVAILVWKYCSNGSFPGFNSSRDTSVGSADSDPNQENMSRFGISRVPGGDSSNWHELEDDSISEGLAQPSVGIPASFNSAGDPKNQEEILSSELLPQENLKNGPDWAEKFSRSENLLVQENFIAGNTEGFLTNELPCSKRFSSLDLRKPPVIKVIPDFTPFNQTVVHPSCIAFDQTRPLLDGE